MSTKFFIFLALCSTKLSKAFPTNVLRTNPAVSRARGTTILTATKDIASSPNRFSASAWSKRGIGFDFWDNGDRYTNAFNGLPGNKVSWAYSWDSAPSPNWPNGDDYNRNLNFVPMLWCPGTKYSQHIAKWHANMGIMIDAGAKVLLSFNEPDMCEEGAGGICLTDPFQAALMYAATTKGVRSNQNYQIKGIRLGSPAVTSTNDSNRLAGLPWLRVFLENCKDFNCTIDLIPIHWYGRANEAGAFLNHINEAAGIAGGRPLWITEFGFTGGSDDEKINFLRQILPELEKDGRVERYVFYKASKGYMFNDDGSLNSVGLAYATI